ncbi:histidine phosphatase family protein [Alkalihalophilus marmarensis]|uniref:histidine phosphatase family protein n=1 Tax=Alkalihalophilus marmarensis TaxID=521377 RepID=UPI002DB6FC58|nr:histidine phosphatase family protein [Alkalihalophilus marmarensis]MEC2072389.1 histidine phosphatase family protein [Alkalihalophilus marmarensis]
MNLYLIRHGESEGNRLGKIQGWSDFPLSEIGKKQALKLGNFFQGIQLDYLYSSDLTRAHDTALAIGSEKDLTVHKWEKVREVNLGPFQGLSRDEIYEQFPEVRETSILTSGIAGTESVHELTERCKYVVDQLKRAHKNDHVAIVSHGGFISIFLMYLMIGDNWGEFHRPFQIGNTSISHIELSRSGKPLFHYINRDHHLSMEGMASKKMGLL